MSSLHSSSALCCNVFHYPRRLGLIEDLTVALGLPTGDIRGVRFEGRLRITNGPCARNFPKPANLDLIFDLRSGGEHRLIGIESKFCEPFGPAHKTLSPTYLKTMDIWSGLPHTRDLAGRLTETNGGFVHLDAPQLVKHALALRNASAGGSFKLLYLWYDVPSPEASRHRSEIEEFCRLLNADGIAVQALTYQDLIGTLASKLRPDHAAYANYIVERYL